MTTNTHRLTAVSARRVLFDNQIEDRYLTSAELAIFLGLSEHTIRAWRKFRIITPIKFGRSVRWLLSDVLEELAKRRHSNEKS
ncbi:MAG: helix-turn-helix domain-containing protein [Bdellovibrionales bacterium]|nr:helix-turn-helix domain-containing protein [Bdellovibrionales bacterium]